MRAWLQRRRLERALQDYRRGYDWAAGVLLRGEMTAAAIDAIDGLTYSGTGDFDDGAIVAMEHLVHMGTIGDDRE